MRPACVLIQISAIVDQAVTQLRLPDVPTSVFFKPMAVLELVFLARTALVLVWKTIIIGRS